MNVKYLKTSYSFRTNDDIEKSMNVIIEYCVKNNDYVITEVEIDDDRYDQYYIKLNEKIKQNFKDILVKEIGIPK